MCPTCIYYMCARSTAQLIIKTRSSTPEFLYVIDSEEQREGRTRGPFDRQAERQLVRTEAARRRVAAQLEREQAETGQAWAAGQGIFRREMGAQRREERWLEQCSRLTVLKVVYTTFD